MGLFAVNTDSPSSIVGMMRLAALAISSLAVSLTIAHHALHLMVHRGHRRIVFETSPTLALKPAAAVAIHLDSST
jgi:hypothetical protein